MSYSEEFQTVDLIIDSKAETRGIDAFALSLIKAERQLRRIVTHLIYQFPCFSTNDAGSLRKTLGENRKVYFDGFERGFDKLYSRTVKALIGLEYDSLRSRLTQAIELRNKIFHGQLTNQNLSRDDLFGYVSDIRAWCLKLAGAAESEFAYDGFTRNSFRKSTVPELWRRFKIEIKSLTGC